jgi:hypothetical protein
VFPLGFARVPAVLGRTGDYLHDNAQVEMLKDGGSSERRLENIALERQAQENTQPWNCRIRMQQQQKRIKTKNSKVKQKSHVK